MGLLISDAKGNSSKVAVTLTGRGEVMTLYQDGNKAAFSGQVNGVEVITLDRHVNPSQLALYIAGQPGCTIRRIDGTMSEERSLLRKR